jgi:Putative transposase
MQGTATHLVDRVLPRVPMRQWVLSLPRWARFLLARPRADHGAPCISPCAASSPGSGLRARRLGVRGTQAGAVTFVQRFGSALNLNVHFHCVVPDGVWARTGGVLRFVPLPALTDDDVAQVLRRLERRVRALLKPRLDAVKEDARPPDALAASQAESVSALRGRPTDAAQPKRLAAYHQGFSLHAGVHLHANDRQGLANCAAMAPVRRSRKSGFPRSPMARSPTA